MSTPDPSSGCNAQFARRAGVVSEFGKNRTLSERLATRDAIVKHFVIYGILLKLA